MLCIMKRQTFLTFKRMEGGCCAFAPKGVFDHLGDISRTFTRHRQEDAHEFATFVIDAMQKACLARWTCQEHIAWVSGPPPSAHLFRAFEFLP